MEFARLKSPLGELIVRAYEDRDVPYQADYLLNSPKEFLESIGFATERLPTREEWIIKRQERMAEAKKTGKTMAIIAEFDGRAVSMMPLDLRNEDGVPRLHFHIFEPALRGHGLGPLIFREGVKVYAREHGFHRFFIEPRANNERMNGLMRKLGFRHLEDLMIPAGPVTQSFLASRYEILAAPSSTEGV